MKVRKIISSLFVVLFFFLPAVSFGVTMTIGDVIGLQGDSIAASVTGGVITHYQCWNTGLPEDGVLNLRIDMREVKAIESLVYTNRINGGSNSVAKSARILIAPDENAPGFDPNALASYTICITSPRFGDEQPAPVVNTLAVQRVLFAQQIYSRRYLILQVYENFYCLLNNYSNTNRYLVQCGDLALGVNRQRVVSMSALGGDLLSMTTGGGKPITRIYYDPYNTQDDGTIDACLNIGKVATARALTFVNRLDAATLYSIEQAKVYVAADENDPAFDCTNKDHYTVCVFDGSVTPITPVAAFNRVADINTIDRRFFRISAPYVQWGQVMHDPFNLRNTLDFGGYGYIGEPNSPQQVAMLNSLLNPDLSGDCYINMNDVTLLSEQWLKTSDITDIHYEIPVPYTASYTIPKATTAITVDGDLSDWAGPIEWMPLDKMVSSPIPTDINDAYFAAKWSALAGKMYIAVRLKDYSQTFLDTPPFIGKCDYIGVYCQGDIANGDVLYNNPAVGPVFKYAQGYFIGAKATSGNWAIWSNGDANTILADTGFESAVTVVGEEIVYEAGFRLFDNYGGYVGDTGSNVITSLVSGKTIRLDVQGYSYFSSLSGIFGENLKTSKATTRAFTSFELVDAQGLSCGKWGYFGADLNHDCRADFRDFAELGLGWLKCNNPVDSSCTATW